MEGDDGVHRSICCGRLRSADSRRLNWKLGIVDVDHLVAFRRLRHGHGEIL